MPSRDWGIKILIILLIFKKMLDELTFDVYYISIIKSKNYRVYFLLSFLDKQSYNKKHSDLQGAFRFASVRSFFFSENVVY